MAAPKKPATKAAAKPVPPKTTAEQAAPEAKVDSEVKTDAATESTGTLSPDGQASAEVKAPDGTVSDSDATTTTSEQPPISNAFVEDGAEAFDIVVTLRLEGKVAHTGVIDLHLRDDDYPHDTSILVPESEGKAFVLGELYTLTLRRAD